MNRSAAGMVAARDPTKPATTAPALVIAVAV